MKPLFLTSYSILMSTPPGKVRDQQTEMLLGVTESPRCASPVGAARTVCSCAWLSLQVADMALGARLEHDGEHRLLRNQLGGLDIPYLSEPVPRL